MVITNHSNGLHRAQSRGIEIPLHTKLLLQYTYITNVIRYLYIHHVRVTAYSYLLLLLLLVVEIRHVKSFLGIRSSLPSILLSNNVLTPILQQAAVLGDGDSSRLDKSNASVIKLLEEQHTDTNAFSNMFAVSAGAVIIFL